MQNLYYQHKVIKTERRESSHSAARTYLVLLSSNKENIYFTKPLIDKHWVFFALTDDILADLSVSLGEVTTAHFNKVDFLKRGQCEGCSMIIYLLMALYDYDFKCIEGRYIKDIL